MLALQILVVQVSVRDLYAPQTPPFAMLDLITIFSAAGLQQELKNANGDKSLLAPKNRHEPTYFLGGVRHRPWLVTSFSPPFQSLGLWTHFLWRIAEKTGGQMEAIRTHIKTEAGRVMRHEPCFGMALRLGDPWRFRWRSELHGGSSQPDFRGLGSSSWGCKLPKKVMENTSQKWREGQKLMSFSWCQPIHDSWNWVSCHLPGFPPELETRCCFQPYKSQDSLGFNQLPSNWNFLAQVDGAVSQSFEAIFGKDEEVVAPKKVDWPRRCASVSGRNANIGRCFGPPKTATPKYLFQISQRLGITSKTKHGLQRKMTRGVLNGQMGIPTLWLWLRTWVLKTGQSRHQYAI